MSALDLRPAARRLRAARIARLLAPVSAAAGGFVSTELAVWLPGGRLGWPEVALACREPPTDGRLDRPPELVVVLEIGPSATAEAAAWLEAGVTTVWCIGRITVEEHGTDGTTTRRVGEWLTVHGHEAVRVPVHRLLA